MSQDVSLSDKAVSFGDAQLLTAQLNSQPEIGGSQMKTLLWKPLSSLPPHLPVMDGHSPVLLSSGDIQIAGDQALIDEAISFAGTHHSQDVVQTVEAKPAPFVESKYDDSLLWCEDCQRSVTNQCTVHGMLTVVRDRIIPSRAKLTAPHFLSVRKVTYIAGGEEDVFGVFTRKVIQKRTQFGPYEGKLCDVWTYESTKRTDRIPLKLFFNDGSSKYYDCTDQSTCNWMMFVQPAKTAEEQNIVVYQHRGAIYFATTKPIPLNTQLKAWYSAEYGRWMGKPPLPGCGSQEIMHKLTQPPGTGSMHDYGEKGDIRELDDLKLSNLTSDVISAQEGDLSRTGHTKDDIERQEDISEEEQEDDVAGGNDGDNEDNNDVGEEGICHSDGKNAAVRNSKVEVDYRDDGEDNLTCAQCMQTFATVDECQAHSCDVNSLDDVDLGRRTLSKRKGRPLKIRTKRKRGRPRKATNVETPTEEVTSAEDTKDPRSGSMPPKRRRGRPKKYEPDGDMVVGYSPSSPRGTQASRDRKTKTKRTPRPGQLHICDICGKAFGKLNKLQIHIYSHTGERPYKCSDCSSAFTSKYKLIRHQLIHSGGKRFVCFYCKKAFARKDHLKNHVRTHNPNKDNFRCDHCGKTYASSYCYRTHLTAHAIENNELVCKVCKRAFTDKEQLVVHLKIHKGSRVYKTNNDKKHQCQYCSKMFFTKKDVQRHIVVHTKTRDYLCQFCPQAFSRRDHLVRHVTHTHCSEVDADKLAPCNRNMTKRRWARNKTEEPNFTVLQQSVVTMPSSEGSQVNTGEQVQETFIIPDKQYNMLNTYNHEPGMRSLDAMVTSNITEIVSQEHYIPNSSVLLDGNLKQEGLVSAVNQMDVVMKSADPLTAYLPRQMSQEPQQVAPVTHNYIQQYAIPEKVTLNPENGTATPTAAAAGSKQQMAMNLAQPTQPGSGQTTLIMSYGDAMKLLGASFPDDQSAPASNAPV